MMNLEHKYVAELQVAIVASKLGYCIVSQNFCCTSTIVLMWVLTIGKTFGKWFELYPGGACIGSSWVMKCEGLW